MYSQRSSITLLRPRELANPIPELRPVLIRVETCLYTSRPLRRRTRETRETLWEKNLPPDRAASLFTVLGEGGIFWGSVKLCIRMRISEKYR